MSFKAILQKKALGLFFLLAFFSSSQAFCEESFPFLAEITSDKVNVRAGQNTNFEKMASLNKGEAIVVYGREFDWYKIQLPASAKVYLRADYAALLDGTTAAVTGTLVNVRAGAGTTSTSVGQLKKDDRVKVLAKSGDWLQIQPKEGMFAWVKKDFVAFKSSQIPSLDSLDQSGPSKNTISFTVILIKASGKLEPVLRLQNPSQDTFTYRLTSQDQTLYYIQDGAVDLSYFLNNQITLEGRVLESSKISLPAPPVLSVSKIMLVL